MKILLVSPNHRQYVFTPNLGLGYLSAALEKSGHKTAVLICNKERISYKKFRKYIVTSNFDIVGFQVFSLDLNHTRQYLQIIKNISPRIITVVGGPHPSGDPVGTMHYLANADFGFKGEAESAFSKLVDNLAHSSGRVEKLDKDILLQIPGLIWRNNKNVEVNNPHYVENLDDLAFPNWNLMKPQEFARSPHGGFAKRFPVAPVIITRGCPYQCTFCAARSICGGTTRSRSIPNVMAEIKYLHTNFNVQEIHVHDDNFAFHQKLFIDFCKELIKSKMDICWACPSGIRLDNLNEEMVYLMQQSRCHSVSVGIEFGTDRLLELTKKQLSLKIIKEKIALIKKSNIQITGFFILGYPQETQEEINETIQFSLNLDIDKAQFAIFTPLPGSETWDILQKQDRLKNVNFDRMFFYDVAFNPSRMPGKMLKKLQKRAYLRFYLRWPIIRKILKALTSLSQAKHLLSRAFYVLR